MTDNLPIPASDGSPVPSQARDDAQLISLWLHGRSRHTQRAYLADVQKFMGHVGKPLMRVTLGDVQAFGDKLEEEELAPASRNRTLAAVKSLFAFGHRIGYLRYDVCRPVRLVPARDALAERILSEQNVQRMLALETHPRNHALLMLLYGAGLRVGELCSLRWKDCTDRDGGAGQITVFGKGNKTRTILLPEAVWQTLEDLRDGSADDGPVFVSRRGGALSASQAWRIVRRAAERAGIDQAVSCHWLRHAHASHAIDRGAPIHLVQGTLGHSSIATTGRYLHARPTESSGEYLPL